MKKNNLVYNEIIELLNFIIEEDPTMKKIIENANTEKYLREDELKKAIEEVSSKNIKNELQSKLNNYKHSRKQYLMSKYGVNLFSDRIIRSVVDNNFGTKSVYKKLYSVIKKYY